MNRKRIASIIASLSAVFAQSACTDSDKDRLSIGLERAAVHEREGRLHDAAVEYESLLTKDLAPDERVDVRFRLAKCRIAGNDLSGALESLDELVEDDVKSFQLDLGPLYLELGDKYFDKGDRKKAQLAWQLGRGVSPSRIVEFNKRIEQLLPPDPPPSGSDAGTRPSNDEGN